MLRSVIKKGNESDSFKHYCCRYRKIYNKVIRKAKKLHNDNYIMCSLNKSRAMWDLINKELGKDKHSFKNTQLVQN